jgi:hypothetical protein
MPPSRQPPTPIVYVAARYIDPDFPSHDIDNARLRFPFEQKRWLISGAKFITHARFPSRTMMPSARAIALADCAVRLSVLLRRHCGRRLSASAWLGVKDQSLLGKKLQRAVAFRVNGVSETALNGGKHGDDLAYFMAANRVFDLLANRELRHRKLLPESLMRFYLQSKFTIVNSSGSRFFQPVLL